MMERKREPSYWVFSREISENTHTIEESDEDGKREYTITPTGVIGRRFVFCGTVTEKRVEDNSTRLVISDRTGAFYVNVFHKEFNEHIWKNMEGIGESSNVFVVAKINFFRSAEGRLFSNMNPEIIKETDLNSLNYWNTRTGHFLRRRLMAINEIKKSPEIDIKTLIGMGFTEEEAKGAVEAVARYVDYNYGTFEELLTVVKKPELPEDTSLLKEEVLEEIRKQTSSGGIHYDDLLVFVRNKGKDAIELDEILNSLGIEGEIYESSKRKFKSL